MEKLVPKLRFPEFEGNWERKKTIDIAPLQRGFDLPTSDVVEGDYPVVYSNGILRSHNNFKVKAPGVVTGRSGTIGKVTYVEKDYWPHNTSLWVTDFKNNNPKFIFYFYSIFNLDKYNAGSTVPTLNRNDVHNIKKIIPQPEEQQKIATFLTSVDERLTLLAQQKEKLELYKKGIMQQIFSQKLRFKDENGNSYPDWEEKKLGEIFKIGSGKDYKHLNKGNIPVYGTGGYMTSVDQYLYDGESVGIGRKGTIDKPVFLKGKFWTVDTLFYTHNFINVLPYFVYLIFQTIDWVSNNEGSGVPSLSKSTIEKIKTKVPSKEEQQKIASFLSAIDVQIEGVSNKIAQTKLFKKGLLQQMFV